MRTSRRCKPHLRSLSRRGGERDLRRSLSCAPSRSPSLKSSSGMSDRSSQLIGQSVALFACHGLVQSIRRIWPYRKALLCKTHGDVDRPPLQRAGLPCGFCRFGESSGKGLPGQKEKKLVWARWAERELHSPLPPPAQLFLRHGSRSIALIIIRKCMPCTVCVTSTPPRELCGEK